MMENTYARQDDIYQPEMATVVRSEPMTELERFIELKLDSWSVICSTLLDHLASFSAAELRDDLDFLEGC